VKAPPIRVILYGILYAGLIGGFVGLFTTFAHPDTGHTWTARIGEDFADIRTARLQTTPHYQHPGIGYDGQFYAENALYPTLQDSDLSQAADNFPYRARRILFSWTAFVAGLGDPAAILQAYSIQNLVFWVGLAVLLLRWLPPTNLTNVIRYYGILLSSGAVTSCLRALPDLPATTLVVGAMLLLEKKKPWWSTAVLALATLGKETFLLASAVLAKPETLTSRANLARFGLQVGLIVTPFALWFAYVQSLAVPSMAGHVGEGNFSVPFWQLLRRIFELASAPDQLLVDQANRLTLICLLALLAQMLFFLLRPRWACPWWRLGAIYSGLVAVLGTAVYAGDFPAVLRIALPVTVAFNLAVPAGRKWLPLLILANASILPSITVHRIYFHELATPFLGNQFHVSQDGDLVRHPETNEYLGLDFAAHWSSAERRGEGYRRWGPPGASITFENPFAQPTPARLAFTVSSHRPSVITLDHNAHPVFSGPADPHLEEQVVLNLILAPGRNTFVFDIQAVPGRELLESTLAVNDLQLVLLR